MVVESPAETEMIGQEVIAVHAVSEELFLQFRNQVFRIQHHADAVHAVAVGKKTRKKRSVSRQRPGRGGIAAAEEYAVFAEFVYPGGTFFGRV